MDYANTETPSMHRRLGSATLSQLVFPGEGNLNFPREKSLWDNTVVKSPVEKSWINTVRREEANIGQPNNNNNKTYEIKQATTKKRRGTDGWRLRYFSYSFCGMAIFPWQSLYRSFKCCTWQIIITVIITEISSNQAQWFCTTKKKNHLPHHHNNNK